MAVLYTPHFIQFFDDDGAPLAGGKLYTYEAGTSTEKATYTTAAGTVENANPVVLDASGRAVVFLSGSYKFTLKDSADVTIRTTDNVSAFSTVGASGDAFFQEFSGDGAETGFTLSEDLGTEEKAIMVFVDAGAGKGFDIQPTSAYTVSGTTLTFDTAPASGTDNIQVWAPSLLVATANAAAIAAAASETAASNSATLASQWATLTSGQVASTDYSAKAWSIGGTGVTNGAGAAKEWATKAEDSLVDGGTGYSALHHAAKAEDSATAAAASAAQAEAIAGFDGLAASIIFDPTGLNNTDATDAQEMGEDFDAALDALDGRLDTAESTLSGLGSTYQGLDATLTALAGWANGTAKIPYTTSTDTVASLDFKDEDNMDSDSATALASQQSIKAYVDANSNAWTYATIAMSGDTQTLFSGVSGVSEFEVMFDTVYGGSNSDDILIQIGDSGGIETSGYVTGTGNIQTATAEEDELTAGFGFALIDAAVSGLLRFSLADNDGKWAFMGIVGNATMVYHGGGLKDLSSGEMTQARITHVNTGGGDLTGTVYVRYR